MSDRRLQLNESASATANASGAATARVGPNRPGTRWEVRSVALSATATTPSPAAKLYLGTPAPASYLGGTYDGGSDSTDLSVTLHSGQSLTVEWTGAAPGAVLTVSVLGDLVTV